MEKDGRLNFELANVPAKRDRMFADIFNTLVELRCARNFLILRQKRWRSTCRWRHVLALIAAAYALSWLLFACLYVMEPLARNHFGQHNLTDTTLCVANVYTFVDMLMFSVETQSSIGYGFRCAPP